MTVNAINPMLGKLLSELELSGYALLELCFP
jgi:hypothetical protein